MTHTHAMTLPPQLEQAVKQIMTVDAQQFEAAKRHFEQQYPDYQNTKHIDDLRQRDYARLDAAGHIYLDYTGGGLYGESQIQAHLDLLKENVYGNPHSLNPTSLAATEITESARRYVLQYLNADPDEYLVIFTNNASGALKLVGEAYPFKDNGQYLLSFDNHNSVNGIREYARCSGAKVTYSPLCAECLRIDEQALRANLSQAIPDGNNLFAFPAQSNFTGIQHDLTWIAEAQAMGWDVLLDAAAFLPTNRLDLSQYHPDFVTLSFYKMFGYPTGLGALILKRAVLDKLQRPWFAGGTITIASVQGDTHYLHHSEAGFEDGTINYLGIPAVEIGLKHMEAIGIDAIHTRVVLLTDYLLRQLAALQHDNGQALCHIYGSTDIDHHGGTIALNFYDADGRVFNYEMIEQLANSVMLSLRTGCFCNPGAGETAHHLQQDTIRDCFEQEATTFTDLAQKLIEREATDILGAMRISVGIASNFMDVYKMVCFVRAFLNQTA